MRTGIMLCYPFEEARFLKWNSPAVIQPKLDGDRCRAIIDSAGKAILLSSEENEIRSVPHIINKLESLNLHDAEFDGELYVHGAPHSDIHGIVSREVNLHPDHDLMEYHIFDMVTDRPQYERLDDVKKIFTGVNVPRFHNPIQIVKSAVVTSLDNIMEWMDLYAHEGYEGFVLRHIDAAYVRKRSTSMMKFKPRKEDYYKIVDFAEEISITGAPKNALGALICQGDDGTRFNVGSGSLLTRDMRVHLWKHREMLSGLFAHVKYQHITTANKVPRFPVIVDLAQDDEHGSLRSIFEQRG